MNIYRIAAVGLIGAVLSVTLKKQSPEIAMAVSIITSVIILWSIIPGIGVVFGLLERIEKLMGGESSYVKLIIKIVGVAYLSAFGAKVCGDFGESAIGERIELGGKVIILIFSVPVIEGLLEVLEELMP